MGCVKDMIETKDLSVFYGKRRGLYNLNLSVKEGEVFGFLGPNGAGKTTAIRVLLDIIRPGRGSAAVFGMDCQKEGVKIRKRVGYIPGELSLYPNQRAGDYFAMVNAIRKDKTNGAFLRGLCERLDLDPSRNMRTYSRGNKQKVGLISAFMGRPDLLILDEPTNGLDPLIQQQVLSLVREARGEGKTVFFSSHVLSEVQAVCDRAGIIRNGELIAAERIERLLQAKQHRIEFRFSRLPPAGAFKQAGVRELSRRQNSITLEIGGNLNEVLAQAVEYGVVDIEEHPFKLEDIFLSYYSKQKNGQGSQWGQGGDGA